MPMSEEVISQVRGSNYGQSFAEIAPRLRRASPVERAVKREILLTQARLCERKEETHKWFDRSSNLEKIKQLIQLYLQTNLFHAQCNKETAE